MPEIHKIEILLAMRSRLTEKELELAKSLLAVNEEIDEDIAIETIMLGTGCGRGTAINAFIKIKYNNQN